MTKTRRDMVRDAIRDIRKFYTMGRRLPRKQPHRDTYGKGEMAAAAKDRGENEDTIRKARQFADPELGYSRDELNDLCRMIEQIQSTQDGSWSIFTRTHVIRLLSVHPKRSRAALQKQAIENAWGLKELESEIAKRFGSRRHGGRRRRIANDLNAFLVQLENSCEKWRRMCAELTRDAEEPGERHVVITELPGDVRKQFEVVTREIGRLHQLVTGALQNAHPRRELRYVFQGDAQEADRTQKRASRGGQQGRQERRSRGS